VCACDENNQKYKRLGEKNIWDGWLIEVQSPENARRRQDSDLAIGWVKSKDLNERFRSRMETGRESSIRRMETRELDLRHDKLKS
jgi:hypothetical protein